MSKHLRLAKCGTLGYQPNGRGALEADLSRDDEAEAEKMIDTLINDQNKKRKMKEKEKEMLK